VTAPGGGAAGDGRPAWMTGMAALCALAVAVNVVRDLFVPETRHVEVWLGLELQGWKAHATAPLHWLIFATGAWGFWTQRPWILPAAAGYLLYVALSHLIWSEASGHGRGWPIGLLQAVAFSVPAALLLRAWRRERAPGARAPATQTE